MLRGRFLSSLVPRRGRGWLHALACVLMVAALSTGIVVQQAQIAQASGEVGMLIKGATAAVGAAEVGEGLGTAAVCATGVGCGILALAAVGAGLYATQDVWVPWVKGAFGQAGETDRPTGVTDNSDLCNQFGYGATTLSLTVDEVDGGQFHVTAAPFCGQTYDNSLTTTARYACQDIATGEPGPVQENTLLTDVHPGQTYPFTLGCEPGFKPLWFYTYTAQGQGHPPVGDLTWGPVGGGNLTYTTTAKCVLPDGTQQELSTDTSLAQAEAQGMRIPSCAAAGLGSHAASVDVTAKLPGDSRVQSIWSVTPKVDASYPQCDPGAVTVCKFRVTYKGSECTVGAAGCIDWARRSQSNADDYGCLWGPYTLPLSSCSIQERAYETGTETGVEATPANTDGDPATATDVDGNPIPDGDPTPDPGPTQPTPTETGTPTPTPTISGPTDPRIPTDSQPEVNKCWPNGWGAFNPASWVLLPGMCLMKWAFIPADGFDGVMGNFRGPFDASAPGEWFNWIGSIHFPGSGASGCQGPPVSPQSALPQWKLGTIYPFAACTGIKATAAATSRLVCTAIIGFFGGLKILRVMLWAVNVQIPWTEVWTKEAAAKERDA